MEGLMLKILWFHMAILRLMLCFSPQYGYIFPDEFFQSTEIMAGDIFNFSHHRTWEWNPNNPARNIVFPIISSGIPFMILKLAAWYANFTITSHLLLLAPRLWMTLQSFVIDYMIYKVTDKLFLNEDIASTAAVIFASSYTCWVYTTRTFSNATELLFLAILLHLVTSYRKAAIVDKVKDDDENVKKSLADEPTLNDEADTKNDNEVNNINKSLILCESESACNPFLISAVLVAGFFIRTSFLGFAIAPILYWCFKGFSTQLGAHSGESYNLIHHAVRKSVTLIPGACITAFLFVMFDCAYFSHEKLLQLPLLIQEMNYNQILDWIKTIPLTPLNIMLYNLNSSNLEKHGIHPWYLHIAVNLPLLFGPLLYPFVAVIRRRCDYLSSPGYKGNRRIFILLTGTYAFGLISLSFIPHQEPRHILPVVIPLAVLSARHMHPLSSHKLLVTLWVIFNFFGLSMFGIFHQGGVVPSMEYVNTLAKIHRERPFGSESNVKVFFYQTYMPPLHLAGCPKEKAGKFQMIDLAESSHETLEDHLHSSLRDPSTQVYLVLPASLPCIQYKKLHQHYQLDVQFQVFPHLSMENPPWADKVCMSSHRVDWNLFLEVTDKMVLTIYKVDALPILNDNSVKYAVYTSPKVETSAL